MATVAFIGLGHMGHGMAGRYLDSGFTVAVWNRSKAKAEDLVARGARWASSPADAANGADALLILTEWEEFANLDLDRLNRELKYPIVIDGRNLYDPEVMAAHGFTYYSVGRAVAHPDGVPAALRNGAKKA